MSPHQSDEETSDSAGDNAAAEPLSVRELLGSILAAGIGIQSNKNRERDFRRGSAGQYIALGIVATLIFVAVIYLVVRIVLAVALP